MVVVALVTLPGLVLTWTLIVMGFLVAAIGFSAAGAAEDRIYEMRNPYGDSVFQ